MSAPHEFEGYESVLVDLMPIGTACLLMLLAEIVLTFFGT